MSALATDPYLHTNGSLSEGCSLPPHLQDDTDAPSLSKRALFIQRFRCLKRGRKVPLASRVSQTLRAF